MATPAPLDETATGQQCSQMESQTVSEKRPGLDDLPTELLLEIVEHILPPYLDKPDIQAATRLSLVNKRMHALVNRRYDLYGTYQQFLGDAYLFLRTLVTNPEAAAKMHSFWSPYALPVHGKVYHPSARDKKIIESAMETLNIPDWFQRAENCNRGFNMEISAAIMMHAPNLTNAHLDEEFGTNPLPAWLDVLKQSVCGNSLGHVHKFLHLRTVAIHRAPSLRLRDLIYLFRLPALDKLMISHFSQTVMATDIPWSILAQPSSITFLHMQFSYVSTEVVIELVKSCPALKRLILVQSCNIQYLFNNGNDDDDEDSPLVVLNYAKLTGVLSRHCKALEDVLIEEEMDHFQIAFQERPSQMAIRNLADMPDLALLSLPLVALVDARDPHRTGQVSASRLPRCLKELTINSVYMGQDDQVASILEHTVSRIRDQHLPELTSVTLTTTRFCNDDMLDPIEERFSKEFKDAGVEFVMDRAEFLSDADAESLVAEESDEEAFDAL